jgi:hypothetical protein
VNHTILRELKNDFFAAIAEPSAKLQQERRVALEFVLLEMFVGVVMFFFGVTLLVGMLWY